MYHQENHTSLIKLFVAALVFAMIAGAALIFGLFDGGRDMIMAGPEADALRAETSWLQEQRQMEAPYKAEELALQSEVRQAELQQQAAAIQAQTDQERIIQQTQTAALAASIQDENRLNVQRQEKWLLFQERAWYLGFFLVVVFVTVIVFAALYLVSGYFIKLMNQRFLPKEVVRPIPIYINGWQSGRWQEIPARIPITVNENGQPDHQEDHQVYINEQLWFVPDAEQRS